MTDLDFIVIRDYNCYDSKYAATLVTPENPIIELFFGESNNGSFPIVGLNLNHNRVILKSKCNYIPLLTKLKFQQNKGKFEELQATKDLLARTQKRVEELELECKYA